MQLFSISFLLSNRFHIFSFFDLCACFLCGIRRNNSPETAHTKEETRRTERRSRIWRSCTDESHGQGCADGRKGSAD